MSERYIALQEFTALKPIVIIDPAVDEVDKAIARLDGNDVARIKLSINHRVLFIRRTSNNEIHLKYTDGKRIGGGLRNNTNNPDQIIYILDVDSGEKTSDLDYADCTIPDETAISVARHYLLTGFLPTAGEGFEWLGNVETVIKD